MKKVLAELIGKLRPNAILLAIAIFTLSILLLNSVRDNLLPDEAFWIGFGVLLTGLVQAMGKLLEPDQEPSVPMCTFDSVVDKLATRKCERE